MMGTFEVAPDQAPLAFKMRAATHPEIPPTVMLHGLGGDEHAIWELEPALPPGGLIVALRAPYLQAAGGYGWLPQIGAWPPMLEEFAESVRLLESLLQYLDQNHGLDRGRLVLFGFSQGAAMIFAAAMTAKAGLSIPPAAIAVGSGHLPQGDLSPLRGLPVFWGHGTRDELIPVSVARNDVERLRAAGAQVQYCEADVTHKLGLACLRELRQWIPARFADPHKDPLGR
ncbi:MAG: alpha/beta hydrolase [Anaerolineales bacterium]